MPLPLHHFYYTVTITITPLLYQNTISITPLKLPLYQYHYHYTIIITITPLSLPLNHYHYTIKITIIPLPFLLYHWHYHLYYTVIITITQLPLHHCFYQDAAPLASATQTSPPRPTIERQTIIPARRPSPWNTREGARPPRIVCGGPRPSKAATAWAVRTRIRCGRHRRKGTSSEPRIFLI